MAAARALVYAAGTVLFIASLAFVALTAARNWPEIVSAQVRSPLWLAASVGIYSTSHLSTGLAWPLALRRIGESIGVREGLRIGLVAQIGKYLPGNIAHYVGRGALARAAGVPLRSSGLSTAVELVSALGAAMLVAAVLAIADPRPLHLLGTLDASAILPALAILVAAVACVAWLVRRGHGVRVFWAPVACLSASLLMSGLSFAALLTALGYSASVTLVIAAVSLAWVLGFLVPGAPAGIGIREAVLIAGLSPQIGISAAVTAAVLHRCLTALVDTAAALGGYVWLSVRVRRNKNRRTTYYPSP